MNQRRMVILKSTFRLGAVVDEVRRPQGNVKKMIQASNRKNGFSDL